MAHTSTQMHECELSIIITLDLANPKALTLFSAKSSHSGSGAAIVIPASDSHPLHSAASDKSQHVLCIGRQRNQVAKDALHAHLLDQTSPLNVQAAKRQRVSAHLPALPPQNSVRELESLVEDLRAQLARAERRAREAEDRVVDTVHDMQLAQNQVTRL